MRVTEVLGRGRDGAVLHQRHAQTVPFAAGSRSGKAVLTALRPYRPGSGVRFGLAAVVAVLVVSAIGRGGSDAVARSATAASVTAGRYATGVEYGVAEPATVLPGTFSAADVASWSQIRADIAGTGSCWLRSDLNEWLTRAIDTFSWLGSSSACDAPSPAPVKVLAIIDQQTVWSAHRLCPATTFSAQWRERHMGFTLDDWAALVRCVATRYRGRISAYEIWNEPLLPYSTMGFEDGTAAHYFDLLRVAYREIKAADGSAAVIALGGSDVFAGGDGSRLAQMRQFTDELLALGARPYADAISLHAYPWGEGDGRVWSSYLAELRFQRQAWRLPIWITETGTRATDPGSQSAYAAAAYGLFVDTGVRHIFWFADTDQSDGTFGLRGRPVESTLRAFALAHPRVP